MMRRRAWVLLALLAAAGSRAHTAAAQPRVRATARAAHADVPPTIDGKALDAVWQQAPVIADFTQFDPGENLPPTFRTEARVAYDTRNLYVLVRAFDPHPDSLVALLSRRDVKSPSDQLKIIIDAYQDGRSGVEMAINPAGVQRDYAIYSDAVEDATWDGVWEAAARVDSAGWVAEFRVPLSQLRFSAQDAHTFGFGIWRDIARLNERSAWPAYRPSQRTLISQLGALTGLNGLGTPRRLEVLPYTVAKQSPSVDLQRSRGHGDMTAGVDLKAGLGSSITLDATLNPDFGQVEADPATLNLSAFEIKFDERRPFFQEGAGLYRCNGPCEGTFYTRRIGRTPQLRRDPADPAFTRILAAEKLTGRLANGVAFGVVNASTERVRGVTGTTIEPQTNYFVGRVLREMRGGGSQIGMQVTDVRRQLDGATAPYLRRSATNVIGQGFHRFAQQRWELTGYAAFNTVRGSPAAIALTQRSSVHYFQRPDADIRYDSTRTTLGGRSLSVGLKQVGGWLRYENNFRHASAGLEANDLGFVNTVNDVSFKQTVDMRQLRPNAILRSAFSSATLESHWTTGGLFAAQQFQLHTSGTIASNWGGALTGTLSDFGGTHCVSCARGGPALRQSPKQGLRFDIIGDPRPAVVPKAAWRIGRSDEGRSWYRGMDLGAEMRMASNFSAGLATAYDEVTNDQQWIANYGVFLSDTTHFTFARLHQHIFTLTGRLNWTATRALSVQLYLQPFVTTGEYSNWRQLAAPRASTYADRFQPYRSTVPPGFNVKQFNSNAVVRWEYRPASTLFLVWQQGRSQDALHPGIFVPGRDVRDLFGSRPLNTLLLKLSYWFNP